MGLNRQAIYTNQQVWVDYIHPADREWVDRAFAAKAAAGQFDEEYRIVLDDGRICWVHDRCFPLENEAGELYRFAGIAEDITERKRVEELVHRTAELDAFRISLADALRPLGDPTEIQATASRLLGERLSANRVAYFEVRGADYVVECNYLINAEPIIGSYPITSFGPTLLSEYQSGHAVSCADVATDSNLSLDQRSAYAAIQIGAHIGIPLIKNGEFVAV